MLNLVHNPVGAFLPGDQASLERDYKRELQLRHGIVFDRLYTITNMPISRFLEHLERTGNLQRYMDLLVTSFNPRAADGVMCRTYLSVGWDGTLYDCDFNQMLEMPTNHGAPQTLAGAARLGRGASLAAVVTDRHCFGCTAGAGSSCAGAVAGVAARARPMCGRFNQTASGDEVAEAFGLDEVAELAPRYNIAPTQPVAVVGVQPKTGRRGLASLSWGLVPSGVARRRARLHQRARRDGVGEAVVQRGLRPAPLPDPGDGLLRVAEDSTRSVGSPGSSGWPRGASSRSRACGSRPTAPGAARRPAPS